MLALEKLGNDHSEHLSRMRVVSRLIGQYLEIREPPREGYVGMVCTSTSAYQAIKEASDHARFMCERQFGDAPYVEIKGRTDLTFSYVTALLVNIATQNCQPNNLHLITFYQDP